MFAGVGRGVDEAGGGAVKGSSRAEGEWEESVVGLEVDAVNVIEGSGDLDVYGGDDDDVGDLLKDLGDFNGGSGGAHADEIAGGARGAASRQAVSVPAGPASTELVRRSVGGVRHEH